MGVRLSRLGHINLTVSDVQRAKRWYTEMLGFEVVEEDPEHGEGTGVVLALPGDGHTLDIGPVSDPQNPGTPPVRRERLGVMHFAFKVDRYEDLMAAYDHLRERRVEIKGMVDHVTQRGFSIWDPDGNWVEVYYEFPTAKKIFAEGRGDRDTPYNVENGWPELPDYATWAGAAAAPGTWRQE